MNFKHPYIALLLLITLSIANTGCSSPKRASYSDAKHANKSAVINTAKKMLGVKYRYGGSSPGTGFDCSGLVQYTHHAAGISLPRTTGQQYRRAKPIQRKYLKAGDLVFFKTALSRAVSHVGIYLGKNKFIHAPSSGKEVTITSMDDKYWRAHFTGAGRIH